MQEAKKDRPDGSFRSIDNKKMIMSQNCFPSHVELSDLFCILFFLFDSLVFMLRTWITFFTHYDTKNTKNSN